MNTSDYLQLFSALAPEIIVVLTALVVLAADLLGLQDTPRSYRMSIAAGLTTVGCAGAVGWMFLNPTVGNWHGGMFVIDPLNEVVKAVILLLTVFTATLSVESKFTRHCGEYFALLLLVAWWTSRHADNDSFFIGNKRSHWLLVAFGMNKDALGANGIPVVTTLAFVGGFTVVFALYGVSVGYLGGLVADYRRPIEVIGGVLVMLMGAALLGFAPRLVGREARVGLPAKPTSLAGAGIAGMVFAVGWTPCIGPILTSILLYAATQGGAGGSLLLLAYGIGLGVPFLLSGLLASWLLERTGAYRRYGAWINRVAGVIMIVVGVLLATGQLTRITQQLSGYGLIV